MKTLIHEIGIIDKTGNKHAVCLTRGLNVVTGKSSTGKSALIEIFDYCFGSAEYTVPKGVITNSAKIYYVYLQVGEQNMIVARRPDAKTKAFFRREEDYNQDKIHEGYFQDDYFRPLVEFKKHLRSFFLDIDDVDESLSARKNRKYNRKAATPSIRSFTSFMLQHQNLVANKHALFYRFDEKEKRDQAIDHTKIFLGLVDQEFFILSQERERLTIELNSLKREQEANNRVADNQKQRVEPVLSQLYAMMGLIDAPISLQQILRNPQDAKDRLDKVIIPENIVYNSGAIAQRYKQLKENLTAKAAELRKLQRQATSTNKNIEEENRFVENSLKFKLQEKVLVATTVCPFCRTEKEHLEHSAEKLQKALAKVSSNLRYAKPMKAKFESSLILVKRDIELLSQEISSVNKQIQVLEQSDKELTEKKSLYETIVMTKARLFVLLEALNLADDEGLDERLNSLRADLKKIDKKLRTYNVREGLIDAANKVNEHMAEIGKNFEFEESYKPINLHFSFETFDLYHETDNGEKIYLRSMGSGANWLYCHVTLFLAIHQYFVELGDKCSVPSILFLDQPTQVYFPSFKFDKSEIFNKEQVAKLEQRTENERPIDDDMKAVENLFSQLSIYCLRLEGANGFSPQIIVTDHADDLRLSNGVNFETLVNGNRWRKRGLIDPIPSENAE